MAGSVGDKILAGVGGQPVFYHSLKAFSASGVVSHYTVVYRDDAQKAVLQKIAGDASLGSLLIDWVQGGAERQDSVSRALEAQQPDCGFVYIHDCARPLVSVRALHALRDAVRHDSAAVLAHPVKDTIKRVPVGQDLRKAKLEDLDRSRLWAMETPQAFAFPLIAEAYRMVAQKRLCVTDDTAVAALLGKPVTIVPNPDPNPKITTPADLELVALLIAGSAK